MAQTPKRNFRRKARTPRRQRTPDAVDAPKQPAAAQGHQPIRWTIERAAVELGIQEKSLRQRATKYGVEPGTDGCYSTQDIVLARYGAQHLAMTRKIELDGDLREARLAQMAAQVIPIKAVQRAWEFALAQLRSTIQGLRVSVADRESLVKALYEIPLQQYMALGQDAEGKQEEEQ